MGLSETRKGVTMSLRDRIRELFLAPQPFYDPSEAARLLAWPTREIEHAITEGEIEAAATRAGYRLAWQEIAGMFAAQHSQSVIEEALAEGAMAVLPELVRLAELRVRIPGYQTAMVARLANRENISIDELLTRHFLDLASAEAEWLAAQIPGFSTALRWPEP
jgi:hypothetical protein